ncbi:TRAP transporter small permease [Ramlibacter solisilvae]|uniref:TRAP transporter small permease protein n=1 Tax=Ramlibacter tataouinensis TaxID=94132 RepID=A0A127JWX2_9BURK|nr:TRAP transporter small permease [Ramlibacter tataouinensis]AMO24373.1 C4-dicarboxylate ABC transporter permease [Ramlibacter tataouinensis]
MIQRAIDALCRLFGHLMVACLALMVLMVFGNVVLRYGFNSGITVSEELSRWLFVWMTFLGAVVALRTHGHLGTDTLVSRLPVAGKKLCLAATHLLMLYICWLMAKGGWQQTVINYQTTSAVMEASMAWFYSSGVVFAVLGAVVIAHEFYKLVSGQLAEDELVGIVESEEESAGAEAAPLGRRSA